MKILTQIEILMNGLLDESGNPLASGKVHTYEAGTTTDKATYTDNDGASSHTNPIILDSNGRKTAFGSGYYKFVVKDSDDVTLYTFDNIFIGEDIGEVLFCGTSSGASNVYTVTPSTALSSYTEGQVVSFKSHQTNTGASTLNVSALGAKNIYHPERLGALITNEIVANGYYVAIYDGTRFILLNPSRMPKVTDAITAAGTTQGTATSISYGVSVVAVGVAGVTDGVILPVGVAGQIAYVFNRTGGNIKIYPASGETIGNQAPNLSVTLGNHALGIFVWDASRWCQSI